MEKYIKKMNNAGVRFLLIGGQAMRLEGMPRFSMDWDFFIPKDDINNFELINDVFNGKFDMLLEPMSSDGKGFVQTFQTDAGVIQFHLSPPGLPLFDEAERNSVTHHTENGTTVKCISTQDLLDSKLKINREQDRDDIEFLKAKLR